MKEDQLAITDLTIGDIAIIRMALKDSLTLAEKHLEKFVSEKRSKKMIKQAKWNIQHAKEKLVQLEKKLHYQSEWVDKYLQTYNCSISSVKGKTWVVEWF